MNYERVGTKFQSMGTHNSELAYRLRRSLRETLPFRYCSIIMLATGAAPVDPKPAFYTTTATAI